MNIAFTNSAIKTKAGELALVVQGKATTKQGQEVTCRYTLQHDTNAAPEEIEFVLVAMRKAIQRNLSMKDL